MADRTVSVTVIAKINSYMASMSAAGKATQALADKVDHAQGRSREGFQMIGRSALAGGLAVEAGLGFAVKKFADFDAQMSQVRSLLQDVSDHDMAELRHAALTMGRDVGFSAEQVAEAETELVKAGIGVSDMLNGALRGALVLAAAGQMDVAEATEVAAIAMTQFKLTGAAVPHIADLLAAGADKALGSVGDLGYALKSGGLVAAQFGLSVDDTIATLAEFAQAGLAGEAGGTVLRQMFLQLAAPSKQAADLMHTLGINVYDASGQFVGMSSLAGQLHDRLGQATAATRQHAEAVIFGAHAIQGANVLVADGAQGWQHWHDSIEVAGFATQQAAGKMDNLSGDLTKLKAALDTGLIGSGSHANGVLREMTKDTTALVNLYTDLPGPVQAAATGLLAVGGATAVVGGAALLAVPKVVAYRSALAELNTTTRALAVGGLSRTAAFLTGPWGLALTAATIGLSLYAHHNEAAKQRIDELTDAIKGDAGALGEQTRALVVHQLEQAGVLKQAEAYGLSLTTVTDAALGNAAAVDKLNRSLGLNSLATDRSATVTSEGVDKELTARASLVAQIQAQAGEVADAAGAARREGDAMDKTSDSAHALAGSIGGVTASTQKATDAAKAYTNALHAQADPVFALGDALKDLRDKQDAARTATEKHGASSKQARQANLDLAQSALEAEGAAATLAGAMDDGSASADQMRNVLKTWVKEGLLTQNQADSIRESLRHVYQEAHRLDGKQFKFSVTETLHQVTAYAPGMKRLDIPGQAVGGPVYGPGSGTSDSILRRLSNGEFIVRSDGSNLGDAYRYFSARTNTFTPSQAAPSVTYTVTNNYPEPEKASESVPRSLREAAYVSGNAW